MNNEMQRRPHAARLEYPRKKPIVIHQAVEAMSSAINQAKEDEKRGFAKLVCFLCRLTSLQKLFKFAFSLQAVEGDGPGVPENYEPQSINDIKWNSDGGFAYSAAGDGKVRKYCMQAKGLLRIAKISLLPILAFEILFDGRLMVAGGFDQYLYLYDFERGVLLQRVFAHDDIISCMCRWGEFILTGSADQLVKFWRFEKTTKDGALVFTLPPKSIRCQIRDTNVYEIDGDITCMCVSSRRERLIVGDRRGYVHFWDVEEDVPIALKHVHRMEVILLCLSPDEERVLTSGNDHAIYVFDVIEGIELRAINLNIQMTAAVWDGVTLIGGTAKGDLIVWDIPHDLMIRKYIAHSGRVTSMRASPDGVLITAGENGKCLIWKPRDCLETLNKDHVMIHKKHPERLE